MLGQAALKVIGVPDVEAAGVVLEGVNPEWAVTPLQTPGVERVSNGG